MNKEKIDNMSKELDNMLKELEKNGVHHYTMYFEDGGEVDVVEYDKFLELIQENKQLKEEIKQYQKELEKADSISQSCIFQGKKESGISFRICLNKMSDYKTRIDKAIQLLNKHSIDCLEKWYDNNDFSEIMNIILEILKGESND